MEYEGQLRHSLQLAPLDDEPMETWDKRQKTQGCKAGFIVQNGRCVRCPQGMFSFENWIVCIPFLSCGDLKHAVQVGNALYCVGRWDFYAARWNNYDILYASSNDGRFVDFETVQRLSPHENLLYPIGMCNQEGGRTTLLFAWNNILGCADELDTILAHNSGCDNEIVRFKLAIDYVRILVHLHSGSHPSVLCNSHSLSLLLSQFLITDELKLVLGAFDNLPALKAGAEYDNKIKCSESELTGNFIAPEQAWPYQSSKVFNPIQQPAYTEKTDIWKLPDVTEALLGSWSGAHNILDLLEVIHRNCKKLEPSSRPTAKQVLHEYLSVWKMLV